MNVVFVQETLFIPKTSNNIRQVSNGLFKYSDAVFHMNVLTKIYQSMANFLDLTAFRDAALFFFVLIGCP